jgi:hypothetical protein
LSLSYRRNRGHNPSTEEIAPHLLESAAEMIMRFLVSLTKGIMMAIGITLPTPEQEKAVAVVWVVAFFAMIAIIAGVGWAVLASFSHNMN